MHVFVLQMFAVGLVNSVYYKLKQKLTMKDLLCYVASGVFIVTYRIIESDKMVH